MGTNLLEALEILAQLNVKRVRHHLAELAVLHVLLPVQHPIRNLELTRVLDDRHQTLNLLLRQLTSPAKEGQMAAQASCSNAATSQAPLGALATLHLSELFRGLSGSAKSSANGTTRTREGQSR
jgi:hypothetical protein